MWRCPRPSLVSWKCPSLKRHRAEFIVWILVNLVGIAILIATIAPVCLDISQASYCEIPNVVSIEVLNSKYNDEILLTDSSGQVFSCRGDLIGDDALQDLEYPVVIICAKHSKLILGVYPPTSPE